MIAWHDKFADLIVAIAAAVCFAVIGLIWRFISKKNRKNIQFGIRPDHSLTEYIKPGYDISKLERFLCVFNFSEKYVDVEIKLYLGRDLKDGDAFATAQFTPANALMKHTIVHRNSGLFYDLEVKDMPADSGVAVRIIRKKSVDPILPKVYARGVLMDFDQVEYEKLSCKVD